MPAVIRSNSSDGCILPARRRRTILRAPPSRNNSLPTVHDITLSLEDTTQSQVNTLVVTKHQLQSPPTTTINDIPPEILSDIFQTYLSSDLSSLIDPEIERTTGLILGVKPSPLSAPLLFCQVCSYWREVAISTSSLWSSIALNDTIQLETVKLWLERSRNRPFSFAVWLRSWVLSQPNCNEYMTQWPELVNILYREVHRWKDVLIHVPYMSNVQVLTDVLFPLKGDSPASNLRMLDISVSWSVQPIPEETVARLAAFQHPSLMSLAWDENVTVPRAHLDTTMWRNLQQLSFAAVSSDALNMFLGACPNIATINIRTLMIPFTGSLNPGLDTMSAPVVAHKLQTLRIKDTDGDFSQVLQHIITPQLKTLIFAETEWGYWGGASRILDFLNKSKCTLSHLDIRIWHPFGEYGVRRFLASDPVSYIPNVILRIDDHMFNATPDTIISDVTSGFNHPHPPIFSRVIQETGFKSCYLGWGDCDVAFDYVRYPFSV